MFIARTDVFICLVNFAAERRGDLGGPVASPRLPTVRNGRSNIHCYTIDSMMAGDSHSKARCAPDSLVRCPGCRVSFANPVILVGVFLGATLVSLIPGRGDDGREFQAAILVGHVCKCVVELLYQLVGRGTCWLAACGSARGGCCRR